MSIITDTIHEFDGKRVLVTGGTQGMGEAIAKRLASAGAMVMITSVGDKIARLSIRE